jgi:sRNA-binding regulator protein Hfq
MRKMTEQSFLSALVADRTEVHVFLLAGTRLRGRVVGIESGALFLRSIGHGGAVQLINRRNIATVCPIWKPGKDEMREVNDVLSGIVDRGAVVSPRTLGIGET